MMEQQTSLTNEKAPTAEEQEKQKKAKAKAKDGLGKAEEVLIPLLEELAEKKPEDLAVILGDDLARHLRVVGRLYAKVQMVRNLLSKAQGIQRAMAEEFNKAAVEVQQEAAAAKKSRRRPSLRRRPRSRRRRRRTSRSPRRGRRRPSPARSPRHGRPRARRPRRAGRPPRSRKRQRSRTEGAAAVAPLLSCGFG